MLFGYHHLENASLYLDIHLPEKWTLRLQTDIYTGRTLPMTS